MNSDTHTVEISHKTHCALAQRIAVKLARELGFDRIAVEEIAIVVSEIASNLVKHNARNGRIICAAAADDDRKGMEIISLDSGPGIPDIELAIEDGHSTRGTMGGGLGAVNRMVDEFEIISKNPCAQDINGSKQGTRIVCRKWLPRQTKPEISGVSKLRFSVMARPMPGEAVSGDGYFIKTYDDIHFMALIDGLGHGEKAHKAAESATAFIKDNYKKELGDIFQGVHRACRRTRGVAMLVCRIDLVQKKLYYAGIGNVTMRVFHSIEPIHPTNYNGIVGVAMRKVRVFEYPWEGGMIVMQTDGIKSRWNINDIPQFRNSSSVEIATALMKRFGRDNDDATVIVGS